MTLLEFPGAMDDIVQYYLDRHSDLLDTDRVHIDRGAVDDAPEVLADVLGAGRWLIAADDDTWRAAGRRVADALDDADRGWTRFRVEADPDHEHPVCTEELVEDCRRALERDNCVAGVAVGSGTINDTVKMAAHRADVPMAVVGTAPSMNGYTSGIASILSDGVKTTNPCTAPRAVVADVDVMADAPLRMIRSGLGDLISKPVSNSDWAISSRLLGTPHSADAMEIIEEGAAAIDGVAPHLSDRDPEAIEGLVQSLMLSGIAMSVAGTSSPASGGEHLVSHYIDMTAHMHDLPYDFHGCQVGVGTLVAAHLYDRLRAYDPAELDIDGRLARHPEWSAYADELKDRYGPLYDAVAEHAEPGYPSSDELRGRLETIVEEWTPMFDDAADTLRSRDAIEAELSAAGCPVRFRELRIDRDRARRAILHSKDIRNRYTVLHLCWELGTLEEWGLEALDALY